MTDALLLDSDALRQSFREWHAEQESLDTQLSESLSALAAYQSHLDGWQQQLGREREELKSAREQIESDRADVECSKSEWQVATAEHGMELAKAREELAALGANLEQCLAERDAKELRCAELAAELDSARAKLAHTETELAESARAHEQQRGQWSAELQRVREELEGRLQAAASAVVLAPAATAPVEPTPEKPRTSDPAPPSDSPVLESIMQQFSKLRQQRAIDREALRKAR